MAENHIESQGENPQDVKLAIRALEESSPQPGILTLSFLVGLIAVTVGSMAYAYAHTATDYLRIIGKARATSDQADKDDRLSEETKRQIRKGEDNAILAAYFEFKRENPGQEIGSIGQAALAGEFPVSHLQPGASDLLTFLFLDPNTGLPVSGPEIGSVFYEVNLDPDRPDTFLALGTSFNLGMNFSFPFVVSGFEPLIRATPFDPIGNPIFIGGEGGDNVAIGLVVNIHDIPEPSTLLLLSAGLVGFGVWKMKCKRGRP